MKNILSQRVVKEKFFKRLKDKLIEKELIERASTFNQERRIPMAVFGNDYIGLNINIHGLYEKEYIADLYQLMITIGVDLSNSTAIDIGANIGNHTIEFSKYFNKVLCFEPNPRTFDILQANTKNINNIDAFSWGCGIDRKILKMKENYSNMGASSAKFEIEADNLVEIEIKPLDEFLDKLSKVALIKIDVEGMEVEALKGAENLINKFNPIICFEQNEWEFTEKFIETEAIDWLRAKGYRMYANFTPIMPKRKNIILRRLNNIKQLLFGITEKRKIVEFEKFPKGIYHMFYAIHSSKVS